MPQCIFCNKDVPHRIAPEPSNRSVCLDCLVEMRRFEIQNNREITRRVFAPKVAEALERLQKLDPARMSEPGVAEQMQHDLEIVRKALGG